MKGVGGGSTSSKRRWRGLALAVLGLIILLSMLVPLGFLFGLHNGILSVSTGYLTDQHVSVPENNTRSITNLEIGRQEIQSVTKKDQESHTEDPIKRIEPSLSQQATTLLQTTKTVKSNTETGNVSSILCELQFGAYCLWRQNHKQAVRDSMVRKMKDLLFEVRAYFPSIAKLPSKDSLTREMRQNIQDFERLLSESSSDSELPSHMEEKMQKMEAVIAKAKSCPVECSNVDKKFRQLLDLTEDEANFHMKQSAFLYQLEHKADKYSDPSLLHFVIFSNNVLAASVAINSTISNAQDSQNIVFHVLTDEENFFAMEVWFYRYTYQQATVQVLNVEKLDEQFQDKGGLHLLPEEFRASIPSSDGQSTLTMKTEYFSIFSTSHYILHKVFPKLKKIVVLDQDVVVQKDLTALWSLDMGGKVNGAIQACSLRLDRMKSFLGGNWEQCEQTFMRLDVWFESN